jgi:hypothetical protein
MNCSNSRAMRNHFNRKKAIYPPGPLDLSHRGGLPWHLLPLSL